MKASEWGKEMKDRERRNGECVTEVEKEEKGEHKYRW